MTTPKQHHFLYFYHRLSYFRKQWS